MHNNRRWCAGRFEIACLNQQRVQVALTWCFNTKPREVKMSQSKKSAVTNRIRAKSLTAVDIKKLIMAWPDRTIEELAVMFGVSNPPAADRCEDGTGAGEARTGLGSDGDRHIKKAAAYFAKKSLHGTR
jgi:hypothetical protein